MNVGDTTWVDTLHRVGRRVTRQRLAILTAAASLPHATTDGLHRAAQQIEPTLRLGTAHAVVNDLTSVGLLRRVEVPASPALYELNAFDNHHHLVCVRCGRLEDVACSVGDAPCLEPQNDHGMTILAADVLYRGLCARCRAAENTAPPMKETHD